MMFKTTPGALAAQKPAGEIPFWHRVGMLMV
jgi:hypothetical protein